VFERCGFRGHRRSPRPFPGMCHACRQPQPAGKCASNRRDTGSRTMNRCAISMIPNSCLRPSDVVSCDYSRTRSWERRSYEQRVRIGVRWWSYYEPALGERRAVGHRPTEAWPLRLDDAALVEASRTIVRPDHRESSQIVRKHGLLIRLISGTVRARPRFSAHTRDEQNVVCVRWASC
jgi:hypothetical protein